MLRFSDARNFGRTGTAVALILGPVLFLVSGLIAPDTDHKNKLKELAAISAHKGTFLVSGIMFLIGGMFLMLAAAGLIKMFRGPRGVTLGQVAGALLLLGSAIVYAFYAFGIVEYEMVNQTGLDRPALAQFLHKANNTSSGLPIFLTFIIGVAIGQLLLGIAAWRTRIVPRWAAVLLVIAGPLSFISNGKLGMTVSSVVTLVGLGMLARRALTMTDEEWDTPGMRPPAAPATAASEAPAAAG